MMNSRGRSRRRTSPRRCCTTTSAVLVAVVVALASSCPNRGVVVVESLAFTSNNNNDLSSRSSSAFFSNACHIMTAATSSSSPSSSSSSLLTMKVSGSIKRNRSSKSSHLIELNNERLQNAGRPGTKKFTDPNKVFIGNLPYDAAESDVMDLFSEHWNVSTEAVGDRIESVKIIRDWRTNKSKGYGFVQFYEPMVATSAMESVNKGKKGWRIKGRRIRLDQGQRKPDELEEMKRKKKKKEKKQLEMVDLDEEGMVIHSALEDVEGGSGVAVSTKDDGDEGDDTDDDDEEDGFMMSEDDMITFMEKGGLRGVMPLTEETAGFLGIEGLYDEDDDGYDDFQEYYNENGYQDTDFGEDVDGENDDDEDDDEEIVYDGVFEEEYDPKEYEGMSEEEEAERKAMNREARRAADKKRKKRKLPFKGFGK